MLLGSGRSRSFFFSGGRGNFVQISLFVNPCQSIFSQGHKRLASYFQVNLTFFLSAAIWDLRPASLPFGEWESKQPLGCQNVCLRLCLIFPVGFKEAADFGFYANLLRRSSGKSEEERQDLPFLIEHIFLSGLPHIQVVCVCVSVKQTKTKTQNNVVGLFLHEVMIEFVVFGVFKFNCMHPQVPIS